MLNGAGASDSLAVSAVPQCLVFFRFQETVFAVGEGFCVVCLGRIFKIVNIHIFCNFDQRFVDRSQIWLSIFSPLVLSTCLACRITVPTDGLQFMSSSVQSARDQNVLVYCKNAVLIPRPDFGHNFVAKNWALSKF